MATAPVSKAAKRPNKTMRFLADIKDAIDVFDDEILRTATPVPRHTKISYRHTNQLSPTQSANYAKLAHFVSGTCPRREPWKIPANYADSTQFAHTVRE